MIKLDDYFTDPDDTTLYYDLTAPAEIQTSFIDDELSISSDTTGTYTALVYASDRTELVASNTFQITVTEGITNNTDINITNNSNNTDENNTGGIGDKNNTKGNESNNTIPTTGPTTPTTLDCENPNPNLRPVECIEGHEGEYFKNRAIYLQNYDRGIVARITTFGNFMIKGMLIENNTGYPGQNDFRVSYFVNDGETEMPTAWIDSETGDLHLRGKVYEEQFNLVPEGGDNFIIQNRKNTNLGYFERMTGNLYLRGNLVEQRTTEDITEP